MTIKVITPKALARAMHPDWTMVLPATAQNEVNEWHGFIDRMAADYLEGTYFHVADDCILWRDSLGGKCSLCMPMAPDAVLNEIIDMIFPKLSDLPIWINQTE